jgi:hypothetical protein
MTHGRSAARDLEEADSDTDSGSNINMSCQTGPDA